MFLVWVKKSTCVLRVHACKSGIHISKFSFLQWRSCVFENCALLGYYAASSGNFLPTFRDNISIAPSRIKNPSFGFLPLKKGPIRCPKMSAWNYHYSLRNDPEERNSHPTSRRKPENTHSFCICAYCAAVNNFPGTKLHWHTYRYYDSFLWIPLPQFDKEIHSNVLNCCQMGTPEWTPPFAATNRHSLTRALIQLTNTFLCQKLFALRLPTIQLSASEPPFSPVQILLNSRYTTNTMFRVSESTHPFYSIIRSVFSLHHFLRKDRHVIKN